MLPDTALAPYKQREQREAEQHDVLDEVVQAETRTLSAWGYGRQSFVAT